MSTSKRLFHLVFTWAQKLTATGPHSSPEVRRELLRVLVLEDELGHGPLPQRTGRSHGPYPTLLLHQLTVDQRHQLSLHGPAKHALGCITKTHP